MRPLYNELPQMTEFVYKFEKKAHCMSYLIKDKKFLEKI